MLIAMAHFDWETAYSSNAALFIMSPIIGIIVIRTWISWILGKQLKITKSENIMMSILIAILICHFFYRNRFTIHDRIQYLITFVEMLK